MIKKERENEQILMTEVDAYFYKFGLNKYLEKFLDSDKTKETIQMAYMTLQEKVAARFQKLPDFVDEAFFLDCVKSSFKVSIVVFIKALEEKYYSENAILSLCIILLNDELDDGQILIIEDRAEAVINSILEVLDGVESGEIQINPKSLI